MNDVDVSITVVLLGSALFAVYLLVIPFGCCCQSRAQRPCLFLISWVVGVCMSALLWHTLGKHTPETGVSWGPWTATWAAPHSTPLISPANEDELRFAVTTATRPLRAVGGGHSWSMTSHTTGTFIDMRKLNAVVRLDNLMGTITVQAGMRIQDVVQYLLARGMCLHGVGSIREQFVGGVISHGVHGPHPDGLNRHVRGLRVLLANGTFKEIDAEEDLRMWRSSMGMLGVIVQATLQFFPLMRLRFENVPIGDLDFFEAANLGGIMASDSTFTGFIYTTKCSPNIGQARIGHAVAANGTNVVELNNQTSFLSRLNLHFNDHMHPAMQYIFSPLGAVVCCLEQLLAYSGHSVMLSAPSEDILPNDGLIPRYFEIIDYEYMLPLRNARTFAGELLAGRFGTVLIPICIRLVRAEHSCLTMAAEDSCVFGVELMRGNVDRLDVESIERRVGELDGYAHFGKVTMSNFHHYHYHCMPQFRTYRHGLDPSGAFLTPMAMDFLGMPSLALDAADIARAKAVARARLYSLALFTVIMAITCTSGVTIFLTPRWQQCKVEQAQQQRCQTYCLVSSIE